jgi:hypothetical protein
VICRRCGDVADIDCATGSPPCLEASNTNGFTIDEAEVTYWVCAPPASRKPTTSVKKTRVTTKENYDRAERFDQ